MRLDVNDAFRKKYQKKPNLSKIAKKGNLSNNTLTSWQKKLPNSIEFLINLSEELECSVNELIKKI